MSKQVWGLLTCPVWQAQLSVPGVADAPVDETGQADNQSVFGMCLRRFLVDFTSSSYDVRCRCFARGKLQL